MTHREFLKWCNERATDGCWGFNTAAYCLSICKKIHSLPFWLKEKEWRKVNDFVETKIVRPIDEKIQALEQEE